MTPGELVDLTATALLIPKVTVGIYYRELREAGLVTKSGRGKSAATLTSQDIATLLIALLASEGATGAVQNFEKFGNFSLILKVTEGESAATNAIQSTFLTSISCLVDAMSAGHAPMSVEITTKLKEEICIISHDAGYAVYGDPSRIEIHGDLPSLKTLQDLIAASRRAAPGLRIDKSLNEVAIARIAARLAG